MSEPARRRERAAHLPAPRYVGAVALVLVLALGGTWGMAQWQSTRLAVRTAEAREAEAAEALAEIEQDFAAIQGELLAIGRRLASEPALVELVRAANREGGREATAPLVRRFADLDLPSYAAAEVYGYAAEPLAWQGYALPLDAAASARREAATVRTAVVRDDDWRSAIALWIPVQDGVRTVGAVRLTRLVAVRSPVQNQYLRDYSLARMWERRLGVPVRVVLGEERLGGPPSAGRSRLLQGADGSVLGRVTVDPPSSEALVNALQQRYGDVLAFWATLLGVWLGWGGWWLYRAAAMRAPSGVARWLAWSGMAASWVVLRYGLLWFDVPARWQRGRAPLAPLFDPTHFASTLGGGLLRSSGDFLLTAALALALALTWLDAASYARRRTAAAWIYRERLPGRPPGRAGAWLVGVGAAVSAVVVVLAVVLAEVAHHAVLDSTLDYFARSGLLPEPLVLVVFCALLLCTAAAVAVVVGLGWVAAWAGGHAWPAGRPGRGLVLVGFGVVVGLGLGWVLSVPLRPAAHSSGAGVATVALVLLGGWTAVRFLRRLHIGRGLGLLTLRSLLPTVFFLSLMLYPLFYNGMAEQQRIRMVDAADTFDEGRDPRVLFALDQVLKTARADERLRMLLRTTPSTAQLDSAATALLRASLLTSLGAYDVSLTLLDSTGTPVGRYDAAEGRQARSTLDQSDALEFEILRSMYAESGVPGPLVEQVTGRREPDRLQYEGLVALDGAGWVMARAEPQTLFQDGGTPFPRVLLPAGFYGELYASLSLAEFRDGVLVRSFGRDFGRYRLGEDVQQALRARAALWSREDVKERSYLTYYRRPAAGLQRVPALAPVGTTVVAVRAQAITVFDHLYYLLRLTVAGLFVAAPFYVLGLGLRIQARLLPAPRVRFRDKVLNAFLGVGVVAVMAVGFLGVQVVTGENERAVQSWLRQHLQDVEEVLALETQGEEMPYSALQRVGIDSVAARVGLDLNLYQDGRLVASSRPQLVRERLIDGRLPVEAYQALYLDGYQFTYVDERLGTFDYTAGYHALLDEQGQPRYVVSVPTLPEQERIEEERARTVAYLFGALLLLVLVVMLTASLLANALARPIARLRAGLEDVARGRFERMLPVDTRDEIGELVETFNAMQEQLAESRRQLAQQERQLAWREMARQVAHEIKNPLTPMKLSVQHLRRAYDDQQPAHTAEVSSDARFTRLFDRVTNTLIEQIDTLVRIANDFSTFARMPTRVLERLDLNAVVHQAVDLMQAETDATVELDLAAEPLVLEADHEELRRVFINLVKNAIQALPDDRAGRIVVSTAAHAEGWAVATVEDNGAGIPEALRARIFEPNFSTKTSGTGLGLAIVKKSLEELNGTISFETAEGQGTTFTIRLPLAEA